MMGRPDEIIDRMQTWGGAIELSIEESRALLDYIVALEEDAQWALELLDLINEYGLRRGKSVDDMIERLRERGE